MKKVLFPVVLMVCITTAPSYAAEYYSDIRPVIERKCVMCHSESSVSFSFEDPEQTYNYRQAIASAVAGRRMPPWLAEPGHQEYVDDVSLTGAELRLFNEWADGGFAKGEARDREAAQVVYAPFSADLVVDVLPDESYLPNAGRVDDYRCFVMDWPVKEPTHITGFRALPGNLRIAHHLVLFAAEAEVADRYQALEDEEEGNGYQCFGGAVPDRFEDEGEREAYEKRHPNGVEELTREELLACTVGPRHGRL